ncbi:uncharacterized protein EHS24_005964 [Apiotrichum porosum]|uniref:Programmed cell death protein 5 n=1 Tax=Apiotrichum porosum TaxID=105984 RepID=A0A427Y068_9TREE|nr:uncharacterized protein EHS24_005964 [Apiotrichum porosum]RSH84443.1 hypothetical protein EHS24_005964 [Apiotrichum porosum]
MSFQLPAGMRPAPPPGQGGNGGNGGNDEERAAQQQQREEMKRTMIAAMLEPEARERLSRISLTRPQLASQVEELLVRMGQGGQIRGKVSDEQLKQLLEQTPGSDEVAGRGQWRNVSAELVSAPAAPKPSAAPVRAGTRTLGGGITIQRKRDDSDSDEYDL